MFNRLLVIATLLVLISASTWAQEGPIRETNESIFRMYKNEVALDTKPTFQDPIKYRGGAWWTDSYLVFVGGDLLSGDMKSPRREERGFFGIRHDDDYPKSVKAHEFVVNLTDPEAEGDIHQKVRFRVTTNYFEAFGKRIHFDAPISTDRMISGNGRFVTIQQGDGNFVTYDSSCRPVGDPEGAIWSAWSGRITNVCGY